LGEAEERYGTRSVQIKSSGKEEKRESPIKKGFFFLRISEVVPEQCLRCLAEHVTNVDPSATLLKFVRRLSAFATIASNQDTNLTVALTRGLPKPSNVTTARASGMSKLTVLH